MFIGVRLTPRGLLSRPNPHHWGSCKLQPLTRPGLIDSKLQAIRTQSNASCECSRYNTPNENMVSIKKIKKAQGHNKKNGLV